MNDTVNYALPITRYMGCQYFHIAEKIVIVHTPKGYSNYLTNRKVLDWIKIIICALFSYGVFRNIVTEQPFKTRLNIYSTTIAFWLFVAVIISLSILLHNCSWVYSILAFVASCLMTYSAFQMLNMEYKSLSFSAYKKDSNGLWNMSYRNEIDILKSKWYLDFLIPIRVFLKHIRFLYAIYSCKHSIDSSKLDVYKYLDKSIKSSELLYAIKDGELYIISFDKSLNIDTQSIYVKNAKLSDTDVSIVAWTVLTALDMDAEDLEWVKKSCSDELSMYSWNKSIIAYVDGKPVGAIISYPGDSYDSLRNYTWPNLWEDIDKETIEKTEVEAYPGEYYLDSMAILPEYRGYAIGKSLIEAAIEQGKSLGYNKFSLLVDCNKPKLKVYYESMGFNEIGEMTFFGHRYKRMMKHDA